MSLRRLSIFILRVARWQNVVWVNSYRRNHWVQFMAVLHGDRDYPKEQFISFHQRPISTPRVARREKLRGEKSYRWNGAVLVKLRFGMRMAIVLMIIFCHHSGFPFSLWGLPDGWYEWHHTGEIIRCSWWPFSMMIETTLRNIISSKVHLDSQDCQAQKMKGEKYWENGGTYGIWDLART